MPTAATPEQVAAYYAIDSIICVFEFWLRHLFVVGFSAGGGGRELGGKSQVLSATAPPNY